MRLVAVLAPRAGLVRVSRLGVDGGDHPVRGHPPGDAPSPVGAIRALGGLDILAGDQRQQRHRLGRSWAQFLLGQVPEQSQRVADQGVDQLVAGALIVPGDPRFSRPGVVMGPALLGDHRVRAGHLAGHPPDRGDQLGDRVLGGHRVVEDRGIQRAAGLPGQHPGLGDHLLDRIEDPVRPIRAGQPAPPVGQRGRVKPRRGHRQPARRLPPQVERHRLDRLGIRQAVQGLQHQHRGHHLGRHRRPPTRLEQIPEQLLREHRPTMSGQEREHPTHRQQMPGHRLHIQDLALRISPSLHPPILPASRDQLGSDTSPFSGQS